MAYPIEITDANFQELVLNSAKPVLVDFWAKWCGPCLVMADIVEELANDFEGIAVIGKIDVDDNPETSSNYAVMSIPAFMIFKDGRVIDEVVGLTSKATLALKLRSIISS